MAGGAFLENLGSAPRIACSQRGAEGYFLSLSRSLLFPSRSLSFRLRCPAAMASLARLMAKIKRKAPNTAPRILLIVKESMITRIYR